MLLYELVSKIKDTNILITGVTGFIGHALYKSISSSEEFNVIGVARRRNRNRNSSLKSKFKYVDDIGPNSDWKECINDMDTIFHLAGKAHDVKEEAEEHRAEVVGGDHPRRGGDRAEAQAEARLVLRLGGRRREEPDCDGAAHRGPSTRLPC